MFVRKAQAGSAPGHTWEKDGDVLEVDDDLAWDLLAIPNGGFTEADAPAAEPEPEPEPPAEEEAPKRKGGRPRLPRDDDGNIIRHPNEPEADEPAEAE